ncbi:MAG: 50S ribosomal protein L11 [Candidatus Dadabacteria bacterium]|nr:50S ribosomal protein L11 [Candidatus Dadabacteria bacterium]MCY4042857.1 50S ribosomal protein L11 [Candidatus Dadabacteria bacterium]MCY4047672.1 50S ribosomal protein L11 [Candidatus Dadabacteria bacterium]
MKGAKEIDGYLKLLVPAGKAAPSPQISPALGQKGINIMEFCKAFNAETSEKEGLLPVVITVYKDKSFSLEIKAPPVSYFLKKAAKIQKGSSNVPRVKVGKVSMKQIDEIAEKKMQDLNANDLKAARNIIIGSAMSMGIDVE